MNELFKCRVLAGLTVGVACAALLCSCATKTAVDLPFPATVAMSDHTGNGAPLIVNLHFKSGVDLPFEIDTGAFSTVIDSSLTNQFGRYRRKAVGGKFIGRQSEDMAIYDAPKLYLGNTQLRTSKLIVSEDLRAISQRHPLKGILGMDCLRHLLHPA